MRSNRPLRAALLALLALAMQLALPLWHMPVSAGPMLCTAQGLKPAPVDRDGAPVLPGQGKACPVCQLAQVGGLSVLPVPTMPAVPVAFADVAPQPSAAAWIADDHILTPAARGPPLRA